MRWVHTALMEDRAFRADHAGAEPLVHALRAYLGRRTGQSVELIETHISWVLLAGRMAFKLKKPVRLPFVDFSSVALRQHACAEELRLNRRLAPQLYVAVLPVRGTPGAPRLGGQGLPIDHLVCMRRFPAGALLGELLASGGLLPVHVDRLALQLARFHASAPRAAVGAAFGTPAHVLGPVLQVLRQLQAVDRDRWSPVRRWIAAQVAPLRPVWRQRLAEGFVREGHGDLHLGNAVAFGDEVTAFDCIEFAPALRWIDVMNDVAFMTMDLKAHGRADLAFRFLDAYLQAGGDYGGLQVLCFYEVYRALVRALVEALRSRGVGGGDAAAAAAAYRACALRSIEDQTMSRAGLLITYGLSGSGKSTLAGQLVERAGAVRLRSDVERKRLFGLSALQRSAGGPVDLYSEDATRRTFASLQRGARSALRAGYRVIIDAAFLRHHERATFAALAAELGVPFTILHCRADPEVLRQRVAERLVLGNDASEADTQVLERQGGWQEPLTAQEGQHTIEVDTTGPCDVAAVCRSWLADGRSDGVSVDQGASSCTGHP